MATPSEYRGFRLSATRKRPHWWEGVALFDRDRGDGSGADRTAFFVEAESSDRALALLRERVDEWYHARGGVSLGPGE